MKNATSIEISTREYKLTYGHNPKGRGSWGFILVDESCKKEVETVFAPSCLLYREAVAWVKAHIREEWAAELETGFLGVKAAT